MVDTACHPFLTAGKLLLRSQTFHNIALLNLNNPRMLMLPMELMATHHRQPRILILRGIFPPAKSLCLRIQFHLGMLYRRLLANMMLVDSLYDMKKLSILVGRGSNPPRLDTLSLGTTRKPLAMYV